MKTKTIDIGCGQVRRELSNYMDEDVSTELRARIEAHVAGCGGCRALYDGVRNVLQLVSGGEVIELPPGFSRRLYDRLMASADGGR
jgi:hypothetical protein